ncbi:MAG: hypothetical protein EBR09_08220 [Proteobacteria bacterium]|nr:hypothetical protein [Pseudomonadota bacterium]
MMNRDRLELPKFSAVNAAQPSTEQVVSTLLMSFVERKVSPQTIADVVRAQVTENGIHADSLNSATCNGIIEVVTTAPSVGDCTDLLFFIAGHSQFPKSLSPKGALGGLSYLLKRVQVYLNHSDVLLRRQYLIATEGFAQQVYSLLEENSTDINHADRLRLINIFKAQDPSMVRLMSASDQLNKLKELLLAPTSRLSAALSGASGIIGGRVTAPDQIIQEISSTADHTLALKGVSAFKLSSQFGGHLWKLQNADACLAFLDDGAMSTFQLSFFSEWFFDGLFREAVLNPAAEQGVLQLMRRIMSQKAADLAIVKGVVRSLQRDYSQVQVEFQNQSAAPSVLNKANAVVNQFFIALLPALEQNQQLYTRQFTPWAMQLPVHPSETRIITRSQWQWLRTLTTQKWEEDLREPPNWIVTNSSRFAAHIFLMAPNFWLHDYAIQLLEKLYVESLTPQFQTSKHHVEYVEFLVRALRKKSPFFASRAETLAALKALGVASPHEEQLLQLALTRAKINARSSGDALKEHEFLLELSNHGVQSEHYGQNPISRTLNLMMRAARDSSRQPARSRIPQPPAAGTTGYAGQRPSGFGQS